MKNAEVTIWGKGEDKRFVVSIRSNKIEKRKGVRSGVRKFRTRQEAQLFADEINVSQKSGGATIGNDLVQNTIKIFLERIEREMDFGEISFGHYQNQKKNAEDLGRHLGSYKCRHVDKQILEVCLSENFGHLSNKTRKEKLITAKQLFSIAVEKGWHQFNPADLVKIKKRKYGKSEAEAEKGCEIQTFNKAFILAVKNHAEKNFQDWCDGLALSFAFQTGLRFSEQAALRWKHIDWKNRRVNVLIAYRRVGKGSFASGDTKTLKGKRRVPLTPDLISALKSWRVRSSFSKPSDLVFPTREGDHQKTADNWRKRVLHSSCDAVLETGNWPDCKRVRWHDTRHFFATILLEIHGKNWGKIADLMGHESADFTRRVYGKVFDTLDDKIDVAASEDLGNKIWA